MFAFSIECALAWSFSFQMLDRIFILTETLYARAIILQIVSDFI